MRALSTTAPQLFLAQHITTASSSTLPQDPFFEEIEIPVKVGSGLLWSGLTWI